MFGKARKKASKSQEKTSKLSQLPTICPTCGREIMDDPATHCPGCGAVLPDKAQSDKTTHCPKCYATLDEDMVFCPSCGCNIARMEKQQQDPLRKQKKLNKEIKRVAGEQAILCTNDLAGFKALFENGIAESEDGVFSRTIEFSDVNYENERKDQQDIVFNHLCTLHHSFDSPQIYQINLVNLPKVKTKIERYLPEVGQNADLARAYNDLMEEKQREGTITFERKNYITFSAPCEDLDAAHGRLRALEEKTNTNLTRIGCKFHTLDGLERAKLVHDLLLGPSHLFTLDYQRLARTNKVHVRDFVTPMWMAYPEEERKSFRCLQVPGMFIKVVYIHDFGSDLDDAAIRSIRQLPYTMNISLTFRPQPKAKMVRRVRENIDITQAEMQSYSQAVAKSGGDPTLMVPALEEKEAEQRELLDFIREKDQQIGFFQGYIVVYAPTYDEVNRAAHNVIEECVSWSIDATELPTQQEESLVSAHPLATPRLSRKYRSLTNAEAACMVPFAAQGLSNNPATALFCGINASTGEPIFIDPFDTKSHHLMVFGMSGGGKGMQLNTMLAWSLLMNPRINLDRSTGRYVPDYANCPEWHVVDWHDEYWEFGDVMGGSLPQFGPGHDSCINIMDLSGTEGDLTIRDVMANFDCFLAIVESCFRQRSLTDDEVTTLDQAVRNAYKPHIGKQTRPDLHDLYEELEAIGTDTAKGLCSALGVYVQGSLNSFSHQTNVELDPLLNVYRMSEVGENLKTIAALSVLQHVRQRAYANFRKGRKTYLILEECQILFENDPAMRVLMSFYAEMRKFGLSVIAVTQLPSAVINHPKAQQLFENTSTFILLPQQKNNQDLIGEIFKLSQAQYERLDAEAEAGTGLVYVDGLKIAMNNRIPKTNPLYKVFNTDPDRYAKKLREKKLEEKTSSQSEKD